MMKKLYTLLFLFTTLLVLQSNAQTLYTNTTQTGSRFNPGLGTLGTPIIAFDDVNIPAAIIGDADSIGFTKIKVGIRRLANAAAITVNVYLTGADPIYPTLTFLDSFPAVPPTLIGTFSLPANGPASQTQILSIGDSVNVFQSIARDTGNLLTDFQTVFVGVSFSTADANQGWRLTTGPGANVDATWGYNVDDAAAPRTAFGLTGAVSTYYVEAFGKPVYAPLAVDARLADITVPVKSTCYDGNQTVTVKVENTGVNPIAAGAASVKVQVTGSNAGTYTLTNSGAVASGATADVAFNNVVLDNPGFNTFIASVTLASDGRVTNDSLATGNFTAPTINTFPAVDDAELLLEPIITDAETVVGPNAWGYHNADTAYVLPNRSFNDSLRGNSGTGFYYFDGFNAPAGVESRLYSNCIKLGSTGGGGSQCSSFLTFFMSTDSSWADFGDDSLYVSISTDKGNSWTRLIPGFSSLDITAPSPIWIQQIIDLSAYNGQTIQIGFEGVSGFRQAFGLDDVTIISDCIVPVIFTSFTAQKLPNQNKLFWKTSQEINSLKYIVEHSKNGRDFAAIGEVAAAGNSSIERSYSYTHNQPQKGYNYYRLKIVDRDGKFKYSETRTLQNLGINEISSYPNPVKESMTVAVNAEKAGVATVTIANVSGQVLYNKVYNVTEGDNNINISTGSFGSGNYILKVQLSGDVVVKKFNKL